MIPTQKRVTKYIVTLLVLCSLCMTTGLIMPASTVDTMSTAQSIVEPQPKLVSINPAEVTFVRQHEVYAAHASEAVTVVEVEVVETSNDSTMEPTLDRTKPIYQVYKDGYYIEVPAEWQWYIRDMATEYQFDEKIIFGLICKESTFNAKCKGDNEKSLGLCQIQKYWIKTDTIPHFTEDHAQRDLLNPYDNILTLMELWDYARNEYNLDITQELDMKRLLYWHNSGKDPRKVTNWPYSNDIFRYANELILIQE